MIRELAVTAELAKTELSAPSQEEFLIEFARESPSRLRDAFRNWRRRSRFFPAIADIAEELRVIADQERSNREQEKARAEQAEARAARESWNDPAQQEQLNQLVKQLKQKLSMSPPITARRTFKPISKPLVIPSGVVMNEDAIKNRRDRELDEIRRQMASE